MFKRLDRVSARFNSEGTQWQSSYICALSSTCAIFLQTTFKTYDDDRPFATAPKVGSLSIRDMTRRTRNVGHVHI